MHSILKRKLIFILAVFISANMFSIVQNQDSIINSLESKLKALKPSKQLADIYYKIGQRYSHLNQGDLSYKNYNDALKLYQNLNLKDEEMDCNLSIFSLLDSQSDIDIEALPYLDKYYKDATNTKNQDKILKALLYYASYNFNSIHFNKAKSYYLEALLLSEKLKDTLSKAKINTNLGLLYSGYINHQDSAKLYFKNALKLYKPEHTTERYSTYLNYANSYQKEKEYEEAIALLKIADTIIPKKYTLILQKNLYSKLANCYEAINKHKDANLYFNKYNLIKDSLNNTAQNIAISNIKEQFDNEKLRADNLESEAKRKQNKNLLIATLFLLIFGGITAFLIQKNTKRKQLLAENEKALETQKLATVLKEQELTSIDAMIAGQEKERQRIANDLHDDLGGLMATVKLHFNTLKKDKSAELFDKTNSLLDEAYQKIRSIAHAKNSGVIAKQGLLKAVQEMASKVSGVNNMDIEVIDHGLENRLENSLELMIFRIIQELVTNAIKHARASQISIHLTNHENSLNIMVEDNGIGFDTDKITTKGMGIHSIDKRVEHLDGNMTIESHKNKGTTIIIDIPI